MTCLIFFLYRYVPVQTLKVSKIRARHLGEKPKIKIKYPKKYSIKTGASSLTLLKNDMPWTLHPLPPPLPTSQTIRLEVDKSMPWALHPLPPPMKTKTYFDYYWSDGKRQQKNRYKPLIAPVKPSHYVKNTNFNKYIGPNKPSTVTHVKQPDHYHDESDYKPPADEYTDHVDHNQLHKPDADDFNHVGYKQVDYKQVDYNHVDYNKSPDEYKSSDDYKTEYPRPVVGDQHENDDDGYHSSYSHDDHGSDLGDFPSQPPSSEYVSHITIEPSIQIASFSETELQGDGTTRDVSPSEKQKCQCTINGHRHKRDAANDTGGAATAELRTKDSIVEQSAARNAYAGRPSHVGHATDVQIVKSHDITDQSVFSDGSTGYVQQVRNINTPAATVATGSLRPGDKRPIDGNRVETKNVDSTFRDDSDKFKNEFGRQINSWDESKANKGQFSLPLKPNGDSGGGAVGGDGNVGYDNDDFGYRTTRKPNHERGYHVTKSTVENSDRGVAFSVQTPFSVSSFSTNVGHPGSDNERHKFRYTADVRGSRTTPSPLLSSFPSEYPEEEPLEFEQFGFQSALTTNDGSRGPSFFSRHPSFSDKPSAGYLTPHFSRDFDDDRDRSKPFRYNAGSSDRFNGDRFKGSRPSSREESVLEYFQPIVMDFDKKSKDDSDFKFFGGNNGGAGEKTRYFGKSDSSVGGGFSKFKKNQDLDPLRLPGRLHESNENLSRKMHFHPSTFDID